MKTLLLNPPKYKEGRVLPYVSREECGIGTVSSNFVPSQICLAANYLRERGKDVDLLDADVQGVSLDGYDVVVVWVCVLESFYEDLEFLKRAKEEGKKTVMILNDPHEGFEMEAMRKFGFIDASVRLWEREMALDKLLSTWEADGYPNFPGVIYRKNGKLVDTGKMPCLPNLEHLSSSSKILEEMPLERYESAAITPGRGCPVGCTFCLYRNTGMRKRKVKDVVSEFETISTSIERVLILDPALPANLKWMNKFCNELIARKTGVSWRTDIRVEHCGFEILRKLRRAGCDTVLMGVETLDDDIRRKIMAGTSPEMLKTAVRNLRRAHITLIPIFYLGYPWDSNQTLLKIKEFLRETPIPSFELAYVKPWKGTPLYKDCLRLGLLDRELGIDDFVHLTAPIFDTLYLTKDEIKMWRREIMRSTVSNPKYMLHYLFEKKHVEPRHLKLFLSNLYRKYFAKKRSSQTNNTRRGEL